MFYNSKEKYGKCVMLSSAQFAVTTKSSNNVYKIWAYQRQKNWCILMIFNILSFRTRSPERDLLSDVNRYNSVNSAIDGVISGIQSEVNGLQKRIDNSLLQATYLIEETGEYSERDPEDEQLISKFESQAKLAQKRLESLKGQLIIYEEMSKSLLKTVPKKKDGGR